MHNVVYCDSTMFVKTGDWGGETPNNAAASVKLLLVQN